MFRLQKRCSNFYHTSFSPDCLFATREWWRLLQDSIACTSLEGALTHVTAGSIRSERSMPFRIVCGAPRFPQVPLLRRVFLSAMASPASGDGLELFPTAAAECLRLRLPA